MHTNISFLFSSSTPPALLDLCAISSESEKISNPFIYLKKLKKNIFSDIFIIIILFLPVRTSLDGNKQSFVFNIKKLGFHIMSSLKKVKTPFQTLTQKSLWHIFLIFKENILFNLLQQNISKSLGLFFLSALLTALPYIIHTFRGRTSQTLETVYKDFVERSDFPVKVCIQFKEEEE